jgi:hypothetical protein
MVPTQLLRTEWPPTPQLAPGHKRFDAVYESLLAGAPIREPLTVRYDTWTVIDGHHRITAARLAGIAMVPVRFWTGAAWVPPASRSPAPTAAEPERGAVDDFADALEDFFGLDRREDSLSLAHEIARRYELEFEAPSPPPKRTRLMAHSYSMAIAEGRLCVHCGCPIEAYPDVPCVPCTKKRPCGRCLARLATPEAEGGSK